MAKRNRLGKVESILFGNLGCDCRAGQGVAIIEPTDEIAVTAPRAAKRRMLGLTWLATNWAEGASRTG
jgi:hypothetical protein